MENSPDQGACTLAKASEASLDFVNFLPEPTKEVIQTIDHNCSRFVEAHGLSDDKLWWPEFRMWR
jgi:hypothetical protein